MKLFILSSVSLTVIPISALAVPLVDFQQRATCVTPSLRKAWHVATKAERTSYTNAVLCLATKPSKLGHNTTLYDDFTYVHSRQSDKAHAVAAFLPWHRYFIQLYEDELKSCGYTGSLLYWDWERSSNMYPDVRKDPIWGNTLGEGIGGSGVNTTDELAQCVKTGPFKNLRPAWYKGRYSPKCLTRQFDPPQTIHSTPRWMLAQWYTTPLMDSVRSAGDYNFFRLTLEGRGHSHVHGGVGGDMAPTDSSPNDPVFFLHHTNVDRYWWSWQQQNTTLRNYDYGGWDGAGVPQGNQSRILDMSGFAPNRTVRDYMVSSSEFQCIKY